MQREKCHDQHQHRFTLAEGAAPPCLALNCFHMQGGSTALTQHQLEHASSSTETSIQDLAEAQSSAVAAGRNHLAIERREFESHQATLTLATSTRRPRDAGPTPACTCSASAPPSQASAKSPPAAGPVRLVRVVRPLCTQSQSEIGSSGGGFQKFRARARAQKEMQTGKGAGQGGRGTRLVSWRVASGLAGTSGVP